MNEVWLTMNQRKLSQAVAAVRAMLERHAARDSSSSIEKAGAVEPENSGAEDASLPPSALATIATRFSLTDFERSILVLCAGVELESGFASLCGRAQGSPSLNFPTFSLALAALPDAHWSALSPESSLRRWRLIESSGRDEPLTVAPLRIAERVLHYLTGVFCEDESLRGLLQSIGLDEPLAPSQQTTADEVTRLLNQAVPGNLPVVQLCGRAEGDKRAVAAVACAQLGLGLRAVRANELPGHAAERIQLARLWERESMLGNSALLIESNDADSLDSIRTACRFAEEVNGVVLMAIREPVRSGNRSMLRIDVDRPKPDEQRVLWEAALGPEGAELNGSLDAVLSHFDLGARHLRRVGDQVRARRRDELPLDTAIWAACRDETRPRLEGLAQRINASATWDDLVLPSPQIATLREIAVQLRGRYRVYQTWGFAEKGTRGLGITALFSGASGTGKTFAAEVLAADLQLDLYRVDLSQVVSKYIGETEKNLRRVFESAEGSGAILLFDEADALFGKRSEVKDSHDRFANIEVSYLLQQMEAYRGLAILTTNLKQALDTAFLRRIRFVVSFPFPSPEERAEIWRRVFPSATPTEGLEVSRLAKLNVTGGNIRNIALNAAFRAADENTSVRMTHLLQAARTEYDKLEKPLTDSETGGWL
ncbi:MAG: AAA family ATPase [Opitutus sp.]